MPYFSSLKDRFFYLFFFFSLCISLWITSLPVSARDTNVSGFNLQYYSPAIDPYGMWTVNSSKMLKPGEFYINLESNISGGQLSVVNLGVVVKLTDKILTTNVMTSLGVTDFVSFGFDFPITSWLKSADFNVDDTVEDPQAERFTTWGLGDLRIFSKWQILNGTIENGRPGIGLIVFSTLPTGEENKFLGNSQPTYGGTFIIDKTFKAMTVSINAGVQLIQEKVALGIQIDDRFTYGIGVSVPATLFRQPFEFIVDVSGQFLISDISLNNAPTEFHMGFRKHFANGLGIALAGGASSNNAIGNPDYRGIFSVFWKGPTQSQDNNTTRPQENPPPKSFDGQPPVIEQNLENNLPSQPDVNTNIQNTDENTAPPQNTNIAPVETQQNEPLVQTVAQNDTNQIIDSSDNIEVPLETDATQLVIHNENSTSFFYDENSFAVNSYKLNVLQELAAQLKEKGSNAHIYIEAYESGPLPKSSERKTWLPYQRLIEIKKILSGFGVNESQMVIGIANKSLIDNDMSDDHVYLLIEQNMTAAGL